MSTIKLTIMKHRPEVSEEEIRHYMDFDRLLTEQAHLIKATQSNGLLQKGLLVVGGITLISVVWFYASTSNTTNNDQLTEPEQPALAEESAPSPDSAEPSAAADEDREGQPKPGSSRPNKPEPAEEAKPVLRDEPADGDNYLYEQATPVDGYSALYGYFNATLVYPSEALRDSVQGIVTVTFIINREGKPEKITVEDSPDPKLNLEAVRLIEKMPPWNPATLNGKPVPSKLSIPITFQILPDKDEE